MIEKLSRSAGSIVGFAAVGKVTKDDYRLLSEEVEALVQRKGSLGLLVDLERFDGESPGAWGADLKFGRTYRHDIEKMAIVGDKRWEHLVANLADPFFARESRYFHVDERDSAWDWLGEA